MTQSRTVTANFNSQTNPQGIQPFSTLRKIVTAREGESTTLFANLGVFAGGATVLAIPSMASAVYENSNWPTYVVRGLAVGTLLGIAKIFYNRLTKPMPSKDINEPKGYAALVKIKDNIGDDAAEEIIPLLKKAFADSEAAGVVIKINSGGGSPVQSSIIYNEILRLKQLFQKKVVVVGEDLMASGAYYIAASADKIYVNANTVTGSIGVISTSYGVHQLAEKLGVEYRVFTAGENKHRLSMYKPVTENDKAKMDNTLKSIHEDFINAVKQTRQEKLIGDEAVLFSGDHWTGRQALSLGLVDELGNLSEALEKEFNVVTFKEYSGSNWLNFNVGNMFKKTVASVVTESAVSDSVRYQI